jgi:hypothetical protein
VTTCTNYKKTHGITIQKTTTVIFALYNCLKMDFISKRFNLHTQGQDQPGGSISHRKRRADKVEEPMVV